MQHIPGGIGITKQLAHPSPSSQHMKRFRSAEPSEPSRNRSPFIQKYKEYLVLCSRKGSGTVGTVRGTVSTDGKLWTACRKSKRDLLLIIILIKSGLPPLGWLFLRILRWGGGGRRPPEAAFDSHEILVYINEEINPKAPPQAETPKGADMVQIWRSVRQFLMAIQSWISGLHIYHVHGYSKL